MELPHAYLVNLSFFFGQMRQFSDESTANRMNRSPVRSGERFACHVLMPDTNGALMAIGWPSDGSRAAMSADDRNKQNANPPSVQSDRAEFDSAELQLNFSCLLLAYCTISLP